IYQDLNTPRGRDELNFPAEADNQLRDVRFYGLRLRAGDDASCLNLYQPRRPRLIGVPPTLIDRGGFRFVATAEPASNPWQLLTTPQPDGAIPVFGEKNTVEWMLKTHLGGTITVTDERGQPATLRIAGLLQDSVFQSGLVMAEANFLRLYPSHEGYHLLLIETPPERTQAVADLLTRVLARHGVEVLLSADLLSAYLRVENTYLSTFQALGGLGLLLGTLGLAVVLVRSVWERRGELALLRAVGYRHADLRWLVVAENGFLLILGLGIGTTTALISVWPHAPTGHAGTGHWLLLASQLLVVVAVGLAAALAAANQTLRAPLVAALRKD
ncbi:MAG: ABC transporter permease, partial [Gemmataceae bacterium]|nr:ABC transporter permease [Gemmataceae bacterium]